MCEVLPWEPRPAQWFSRWRMLGGRLRARGIVGAADVAAPNPDAVPQLPLCTRSGGCPTDRRRFPARAVWCQRSRRAERGRHPTVASARRRRPALDGGLPTTAAFPASVGLAASARFSTDVALAPTRPPPRRPATHSSRFVEDQRPYVDVAGRKQAFAPPHWDVVDEGGLPAQHLRCPSTLSGPPWPASPAPNVAFVVQRRLSLSAVPFFRRWPSPPARHSWPARSSPPTRPSTRGRRSPSEAAVLCREGAGLAAPRRVGARRFNPNASPHRAVPADHRLFPAQQRQCPSPYNVALRSSVAVRRSSPCSPTVPVSPRGHSCGGGILHRPRPRYRRGLRRRGAFDIGGHPAQRGFRRARPGGGAERSLHSQHSHVGVLDAPLREAAASRRPVRSSRSPRRSTPSSRPFPDGGPDFRSVAARDAGATRDVGCHSVPTLALGALSPNPTPALHSTRVKRHGPRMPVSPASSADPCRALGR